MPLFRRTPKTPTALSLDIGTEFVKALAFEVVEEHAVVLGHGRERQRLSDMHGGAVADIAGVVRCASKAIDRAYTESGTSPSQVIIGIAGELVKGTTTTTVLTRSTPSAKMTGAELRDLIAEAQRQTLQRSHKELAWETGYAQIDVQLVNSAVVSVKIDGYPVTNPVGFTGKMVEIGIYTSYAPSVHVGAMQSIADALGLDLLSIATEPYAVARCFGNEETGDISSIFIDVGGGTTDIAVVRSGGLEGTKMFALGGRVFTKRIGNHFKLPFREAEARKLAYSNGTLRKADAAAVHEAIKSDVAVWRSGVELALEEFTQSERFADNPLLPSKIYLCGGGSLLPDLKEILEKGLWHQHLPFAKAPEVQYIKPEQVSNVIDKTGSLVSVQDVTPMALANIALDLIDTETLTTRAMHKVLKGLRE
jgi:cell division protein FtsA